MQPTGIAPFEIGQHHAARAFGTEMQIAELITHGVEQPRFVAPLRKISKLDTRAVRREASHDPTLTNAQARIGHTNGRG